MVTNVPICNVPHIHHFYFLPSHMKLVHTYILQVVATYTQQSETSPAKGSPEEMSTSYEEGARSFPHIPEDEAEKDAPGKRYSTRSSSKKVGHEHMFHQKVSTFKLPQIMELVIYIPTVLAHYESLYRYTIYFAFGMSRF